MQADKTAAELMQEIGVPIAKAILAGTYRFDRHSRHKRTKGGRFADLVGYDHMSDDRVRMKVRTILTPRESFVLVRNKEELQNIDMFLVVVLEPKVRLHYLLSNWVDRESKDACTWLPEPRPDALVTISAPEQWEFIEECQFLY